MSSTGQATSSPSNLQLITNALAEYAKQTGVDLTENPFFEKIKCSNTPEAILELLQERVKAFKDYREGNRRLMSCLSPVVNVFHAFSGIVREAVSVLYSTTSNLLTLITLSDPPLTGKCRLHQY